MTNTELLKRMHLWTGKMRGILERKNHDYAGAADPFRNLRACERLGICGASTGILVRMTDKLTRLANFVKAGELAVTDESLKDTGIDLANYAFLFVEELRDRLTREDKDNGQEKEKR